MIQLIQLSEHLLYGSSLIWVLVTDMERGIIPAFTGLHSRRGDSDWVRLSWSPDL